LRVLLVGLFALILIAQAAAAAKQDPPARHERPKAAPKQRRAETLDRRLERKLAAARKYRGTIRFFARHRSLQSAGEHAEIAMAALARARHRISRLEPTIAQLRSAVVRREAERRASMPPKRAICDVFGDYCREAVNVAWCESRLTTTARNGQYLGLFQMGETARALYGHGPTAHAQATAAHRYFVRSGRDWSPWGCRWAATS
jgi:hypothetical protein